jgi:Ca2+-binding EF-hand superfamily protein
MNTLTTIALLGAASFAVSAQAQRGPMQDPFGDATVSKADVSAAAAKRFTGLDANQDGALGADELGRMARMMGQADTNKDGKLSSDEFAAMEASRFDMMDGNRDGQLTKAERDDFRQQMMARMRAMQGAEGFGGGGFGGGD